MEKLALLGGDKAVVAPPKDLFTWPIITQEDEEAVLDVLRRGAMSGIDVTKKLEEDVREWLEVEYALGCNNGTAALHSAMFGCGVGKGDEVICPSLTYWASGLPAYSLGATVVFADIDPQTLCIDPKDIEKRITPRTKAIIVVHLYGNPADMDPILEIARKHNIKVIEDVSHAQDGLYKGRKLGTIGDVGAMSVMSGKALACGEGGLLVTRDRQIYERAVAFGHYERYNNDIISAELEPFRGLPLGGYKYRMHQLSAAVGRVQLKHYPARTAEIDRAMLYFWDSLKDIKGIEPVAPDRSTGSLNIWYNSRGRYDPNAFGGLSVSKFCEALRAEGVTINAGCLRPLHQHNVFKKVDIYNDGKPTRIANSAYDVREQDSSLPVSESIGATLFEVPWFKHFRPKDIDPYIHAFRKVALSYRELLTDNNDAERPQGAWSSTKHS